MKAKSPYKQKFLATLLIAMLSTAQTAQAATALADAPIAAINPVRPNIMFTLDNSGSMAFNFMPDNVSSYSSKRSFRSSSFNRIYYNPAITYELPMDITTINSTTQTRLSNPSTGYPKAWRNGFDTSDGTDDISSLTYCVYNGGASVELTSPANNTIVGNDANFTCYPVSGLTASQKENFRTWYGFYRTRILMMKSAMSIGFKDIGSEYRIGFSTINGTGRTGNPYGDNFINITDFNSTQKTAWYTKLYSIDPSGGTPLQAAMQRVGEYYRTGSMGYSGGTSPVDPVTQTCQPNFHILSTDGYWNNNTVNNIGNQDNTVIPAIPTLPTTGQADSNVGLTQGAAWPRPYRDTNNTANTLTDVATYYWINDLRPSMANNVPTTQADPAYWQHMVNFTIGMGLDGTLDYPNDLAALTAGTKSWPAAAADSATAIDDLWHAAINSRGQYFSAKDPTALSTALYGALNAIKGRIAAGTGAGISNSDLSVSDNMQYKVIYNSNNWTGDLQAYAFDPVTATTSTTATWSAQTRLTALTNGTGWNATRKIVTMNDNAVTGGVPFRATTGGLSTTQLTNLSNDPDLVNFIRGDATYEGAYGISGKKFRDRTDPVDSAHKVLGDIVSSKPVVVGKPNAVYSDLYDPGYANFKALKANRQTMIYVGANDGMLHAVDAATGDEKWAFIPGALIRSGNTGLAALSYQINGTPPFTHHFYVDGAATAADVDFNNTGGVSGSGNWHTILVGGLNKGGSSFYALDITDPSSVTSEGAAAANVLWQFPNAKDPSHTSATTKIGLSYGKPVIAKTRAYGWVVLVTSGYNNSDGGGYLFVLNAKTGELLKTLSAGTPSLVAPVGLSKVAAYMTSYKNAIIEQVYAGDLNGNVWRFDLSNASSSSWPSSAVQLASFGSTQPFTTAPIVRIDPATNTRWVFIGSGKYLDSTDVNNTQIQTFYALKDGTRSQPLTIATPIVKNNLIGQSGSIAINTTAYKGWYIDLAAGERLSVDPVSELQLIAFTTTIPSNDPCSPGFTGNLYVRQFGNAASFLVVNNAVVNSVPNTNGFVGVSFLQTAPGTINVNGNPTQVRPQNVVSTVDGLGNSSINSILKAAAAGVVSSWQEILN